MRKKLDCAEDALGACFGDVAAVASVVVGGVANILVINCMGGPGESLVWCFVDEDFCTWGGMGFLLKSKAPLVGLRQRVLG